MKCNLGFEHKKIHPKAIIEKWNCVDCGKDITEETNQRIKSGKSGIPTRCGSECPSLLVKHRLVPGEHINTLGWQKDRHDTRFHGYYCRCGFRLNYTTEKYYHCIQKHCPEGKKNL